MIKKIISPCISICKTDPLTGYCYGCARTQEEKELWKNDYPGDLIIDNIFFDIYRDEDLCKNRIYIEIELFQKNK